MVGDSREAAASLAVRAVEAMRERDHFSAWLGAELVALAPGAATVQAVVREEMLNGFGVCHGGVTFSIADSALAFASNTHGRLTMSIENGISYVAPVMAGDTVTARAVEEGVAGRLAFYTVRVTNQRGEAVAVFRGTVYRTKRDIPGVSTAAVDGGKDR